MQHSNITVKDLARICGVSIGTVDRAINNRKGISPETRRRILETAEEYGFVKNQSACSLSSGRSSTIGVIIFNLKSEYFSSILTSIEEEARHSGHTTMIMLSHYDADTEMECARRMVAMNVAGIIVFSVLKNTDFYTELQKNGTPVVAVGNPIGSGIPFVGINDRLAMNASCRYVLSKGYRHLVYIAPVLEKRTEQNISAQENRYAGFLEAVQNAPDVTWHVVDTYEEYRSRLPEVHPHDRPTALICSSDTFTLRCLEVFRNTEGTGIMGFDRFPTLEQLLPKLSGIAYSSKDIGIAAAHVILDAAYSDVLLPFEVIPGETV